MRLYFPLDHISPKLIDDDFKSALKLGNVLYYYVVPEEKWTKGGVFLQELFKPTNMVTKIDPPKR